MIGRAENAASEAFRSAIEEGSGGYTAVRKAFKVYESVRQHQAEQGDISYMDKTDALDAAIRLYQPELKAQRTNAGSILEAYENAIAALNIESPPANIDELINSCENVQQLADAIEFSEKRIIPNKLAQSEICDDFDVVTARKDLKPEALELLRQPIIQSLLYDINLLPEQIITSKHWYYMLSVLSHMAEATKPVSVSLEKCAMAVSSALGPVNSNRLDFFTVAAKAVLEAAGVKYDD